MIWIWIWHDDPRPRPPWSSWLTLAEGHVVGDEKGELGEQLIVPAVAKVLHGDAVRLQLREVLLLGAATPLARRPIDPPRTETPPKQASPPPFYTYNPSAKP